MIYKIKINNVSFRFAEQISVGDEVIVPKNDDFSPAKVTNVSVITMQGNQPFYYRPKGKVMFLEVSVSHSVHRAGRELGRPLLGRHLGTDI